jgi:hypothetical protein
VFSEYSVSDSTVNFVIWPLKQLNTGMRRLLPIWIIFYFLGSVEKLKAQDCEINFDLFGLDTLCTSSAPFPLPPALPLGGTYSGINVVDGVFDPAGLESGEYILTYSVNNETCVGSDDVVMTIVQSEVVQIVGDLEICSGDTAKITSEPSVELTWFDGTKSYFRDFVLDSNWTSTVSGTDPVGCPFIIEFSIRVYDLPDSVFISGTTAVCPGGEATLSVNSEDYFVWFNESSDPSITFTVDEPIEYALTIYPGGICDTTIYHFVDVVPLPEPLVAADTAICEGGSAEITFSGADYFKDQFGTITSPYTVFPLENFTYFIEAYNSEDCFVTVPVEIVVTQYPDLVVSGIDPICPGESLMVEATGGEFYTWLNLDTGEDITQDPSNLYTDVPDDTLRFELTAYTLANCNTIQNYEIPVNPIPLLDIEIINPFCEGETVSLLATGADSLSWSTGVQDSLLEFIGEEDFTLTLYGLNNTGCNDSLVWDVVIHPVPLVTGSGMLSFCEGLSTELIANGADYYVWNGLFEGDTLITAPIQDTIINLVGYTEFGCNDFTNIIINVDPAPVVIFTGDDQLCFGENVELSVSSDGEIVWSDGSTELNLFFTPVADTSLSLISTGNNGCIREATFDVIMNPLPDVAISGSSTVCAGDSLELVASGANSYSWNTNQDTETISITPYASLNYQVTGTSLAGCVSEATFALTVNPAPYAYFEFSTDAICDLGPDLSWVANPAGGILSGDGVSNNTFNPMNALVGLNTVTYTVTNEFNCLASASDELVVDDCSGITEDQEFIQSVYPNPASGIVHLKVSSPCDVKLMNSLGEILSEIKLVSIGFFDLDKLPAGLYMINFKSEHGKEETVKLIVE